MASGCGTTEVVPSRFRGELSIECQVINVVPFEAQGKLKLRLLKKRRPPRKAAATQACVAGSVCGAVKIVIGGVSDFGFGAAVRRVASRRRRLATLRVNALNRCDCRENPVARMTRRGQQQPRY